MGEIHRRAVHLRFLGESRIGGLLSGGDEGVADDQGAIMLPPERYVAYSVTGRMVQRQPSMNGTLPSAGRVCSRSLTLTGPVGKRGELRAIKPPPTLGSGGG